VSKCKVGIVFYVHLYPFPFLLIILQIKYIIWYKKAKFDIIFLSVFLCYYLSLYVLKQTRWLLFCLLWNTIMLYILALDCNVFGVWTNTFCNSSMYSMCIYYNHISNLVHSRFWNNLHQVCSYSKYRRVKYFKSREYDTL
jgi:hypothetical protein